MADQTEKAAEKQSADLEKRVADAERQLDRLQDRINLGIKFAAPVLALAVLIAFGIAWWQIPEAAVKEAVKDAKVVAQEAAEKAATQAVEDKLKDAITTELAKQKVLAQEAVIKAQEAVAKVNIARDDVLAIEKELRGTNAKSLHEKISRLTVSFGTPEKVKLGPNLANAIQYTAPTTGVMVLTDSGDGVGNGNGGIQELIVNAEESDYKGSRVFYELGAPKARGGPPDVPDERGVSHILPAKAGSIFKVWGTQETIRVFFIPLEIKIL